MNKDMIANLMNDAVIQAAYAQTRNEVPVGAVIYDHEQGKIISAQGNRVNELNDIFAHAEMLAVKEALQKKESLYLNNCSIFVTLEPCSFCASALAMSRVKRLYYGAYDIKSGGVEHGAKIFTHPACHHKIDVYGGFLEEKCGQLMSDFFKTKR